MITIVDYGIGNLESIKNMLRRIGVDAIISGRKEDITTADKIVLPGMGSFEKCMLALHDSGLREVLEAQVREEKKPFLGICVGLQMLMRRSDEGIEKGLNWIDGDTVAFDATRLAANQKIPNMGWLDIEIVNSNPLSKNLQGARYYFAHSFHVRLDEAQEEWIRASYGYPFTAAIRKDNVYGVQFHPEKSHKFGMQLLKNFAELA